MSNLHRLNAKGFRKLEQMNRRVRLIHARLESLRGLLETPGAEFSRLREKKRLCSTLKHVERNARLGWQKDHVLKDPATGNTVSLEAASFLLEWPVERFANKNRGVKTRVTLTWRAYRSILVAVEDSKTVLASPTEAIDVAAIHRLLREWEIANGRMREAYEMWKSTVQIYRSEGKWEELEWKAAREGQAAPLATSGSDQPERKADLRKNSSRRMTADDADRRAREIVETETAPAKGWARTSLAERVGCHPNTLAKTRTWQEIATPPKPKAISLSAGPMSLLGEDDESLLRMENEEELRRLIAEQQTDAKADRHARRPTI